MASQRSPGFKALSDIYKVRASATPPSDAANTLISNVSIDTGLDPIRREVLAIYGVMFSCTTSDNAGQQDQVLERLRADIAGGTNSATARFGRRLTLSKSTAGYDPAGVGSSDIIAMDTYEVEFGAWNTQVGAVGDSIGMIQNVDQMSTPEFDWNIPDIPLAYVTGSSMQFQVQAFIDNVTPAGPWGGITGGVLIFCQRIQASADLYASILTSNQ